MDEDAIVKRLVKSYLHYQGEATSQMIVNHIDKVGFGLRKPLTSKALSHKIKVWTSTGKSNSWFRVTSTVRKNKKWWKLE